MWYENMNCNHDNKNIKIKVVLSIHTMYAGMQTGSSTTISSFEAKTNKNEKFSLISSGNY